jgi:tripartite-type tricarboxylate transporter receptor subunit TctC
MPMPAPINRRQWLSLAGGAVAAPFIIPSSGRAQEAAWPARSVRYVNGFPAGGATDVL